MATTMFINNLPNKVTWRWVEKICSQFGKVLDVFIPIKREHRGWRFGFVRYGYKDQASLAVWNLNGVWFLDHKIEVNIARYNSRFVFWRRMETKGEREKAAEKEKIEEIKNTIGNIDNKEKVVVKVKSYIQALKENIQGSAGTCGEETSDCNNPVKEQREKPDVVRGTIDDEKLHWLERCDVGWCKVYVPVEGIAEQIKEEGISDITIRRISGKKVLIYFNKVEMFESMEKQEWGGVEEDV